MNGCQCTTRALLATTQHLLVSKATAAFVIAAAAAAGVVVDSASASVATSPVSAYTDAIVSDRRHISAAAAAVTSIRLHPSTAPFLSLGSTVCSLYSARV